MDLNVISLLHVLIIRVGLTQILLFPIIWKQIFLALRFSLLLNNFLFIANFFQFLELLLLLRWFFLNFRGYLLRLQYNFWFSFSAMATKFKIKKININSVIPRYYDIWQYILPCCLLMFSSLIWVDFNLLIDYRSWNFIRMVETNVFRFIGGYFICCNY